MKYLLSLFLLAVVGCGSAGKAFVAPLTSVTGNYITQTGAYINAAKPHCDKEGQANLDLASASDTNAGKANDRATKQFTDEQNARAKAEAKYDTLYNSWWSRLGRTLWALIWWITGIGALLLVLWLVAKFASDPYARVAAVPFVLLGKLISALKFKSKPQIGG
jgi:hypothetical protein